MNQRLQACFVSTDAYVRLATDLLRELASSKNK